LLNILKAGLTMPRKLLVLRTMMEENAGEDFDLKSG